ncbi:hypothetical protein COU60_02220 [Candidatus Pacearchaeota archaeon CG10_big_fil_rev_8_21_14_0_10_34_76]|nr:MAG: hypothetical protein COU60_02220 [Candidatus Pacearchaeota archaeon CG10_big_fil_rev_8_21_14_0_10_34_76]
MVNYENFYDGAGYGLDPTYGRSENYGDLFTGYRISAGQFGFPTDPRSANQLKAVSDKLSTGTKNIEVSGVTPATLDTIPKEHFKEINRLKKLAGAELTFHGPLVEPTGVSRQGWNESDRLQAERQITNAIMRGYDLDPKGNVVITFHSSNGLPEPRTDVINEKTKKPETTSIWVVDERTGNFSSISKPKVEYFRGKAVEIEDELKRKNEEAWFRTLQHVSFNAHNGENIIQKAIPQGKVEDPKLQKIFEKHPIEQVYKMYLEGKQEQIEKIAGPEMGAILINQMREITHGDIYLREAYGGFQELFNQAYYATEKTAEKSGNSEDLAKLEKFRQEIAPKIDSLENDPTKISELGEELVRGINVLRSINPPETLRPLEDFAIDKASDTFAGAALTSFKQLKENTPIISIENPPVGMGLSRADQLMRLVESSREKFANRAIEELGMSKKEAKQQAEKLIGVTWDVGHINMLRKYGFEDKHLLEEAKNIAPYVKHIHLSDNFGLEHTELPMGMGNVPIKKTLELMEQYNKKIKDVKKVVETGTWFGPQAFGNQTPFAQSLEAFGSPLYSMQMAPYWNQAIAASGGYFSGQGAVNPQIHHSMYGSGFANLPVELGGQMAGRNRLSGAPME